MHWLACASVARGVTPCHTQDNSPQNIQSGLVKMRRSSSSVQVQHMVVMARVASQEQGAAAAAAAAAGSQHGAELPLEFSYGFEFIVAVHDGLHAVLDLGPQLSFFV